MNGIGKYLLESRGRGHTEAAIIGIKNSSDAVLITHTGDYARRLSKQYGIKTCSFDNLYKLRPHKPVIFDNSILIRELSNLEYLVNKYCKILEEVEQHKPGLVAHIEKCLIKRQEI